MKVIRIGLLVLSIIGFGLLATIHFWVPNLVEAIIAHDTPLRVESVSTSTQATTDSASVQPKPPVPSNDPIKHSSGIDIEVTIGPTCPLAHYPELPECIDKPYETTLILASTVIGRNGGVLITTNAQGRYSQDLAPGTYTIRAQSTVTPPTLSPVSFEVKEDSRTSLHLMFDSGIR